MTNLKYFFNASLLRKNISITFVRQVFVMVAQFFSILIIARELGAEGNGIYAIAILMPTMMTNFFNLGVGQATIYFVGKNHYSDHQVFVKNIFLALIIATISSALVLPIIFLKGNQIFPGVPLNLIYLGFICFPFSLMSIFLAGILQGQENFNSFNISQILPPYIHLFGILISIYYIEAGVLGVFLSYIFSQITALFIIIFLLKPHALKSDKRNGIQLNDYFKKISSFGFKVHFTNILAFINYRADIFLINLFINPTSAGIYFLSVQIAEKLWIFSQAASSVLFPRFAKMKSSQERLELANRSFILVAFLTGVLSIIIGLGLYWFLEILFGEDYLDALSVFYWLVPGIIASSGSRIYSNCITAAGKPEWNMYVSFFIVSVNIIGNIILIPSYGIVGAAFVTTIAYSLNASIKFWLVRKTLLIK